MQEVTIVLIGRGGELDRIDLTIHGDNFTLADVAKSKAGDWILGEGDTIRIIEREA